MAFKGNKEFRDPREKELKVILNALRYFNSSDFLKKYELVIKEKNGTREVFAVSKELKEFLRQFRIGKMENAGIKLGEVGRRFRFSLEGAFWLVKSDKKRVWVNSKGEMLFLYGRDIFASSVIKAKEFKENEIVFVCNEDDDVLGIGKSRFDSERISFIDPDRVVIENLTDRGQYLRKKKLYSSF